jgi:hypothetical protein
LEPLRAFSPESLLVPVIRLFLVSVLVSVGLSFCFAPMRGPAKSDCEIKLRHAYLNEVITAIPMPWHAFRTRTLPPGLRRFGEKPFAKGAVREHNSARSIHERVRGRSVREITAEHCAWIIVDGHRETGRRELPW